MPGYLLQTPDVLAVRELFMEDDALTEFEAGVDLVEAQGSRRAPQRSPIEESLERIKEEFGTQDISVARILGVFTGVNAYRHIEDAEVST